MMEEEQILQSSVIIQNNGSIGVIVFVDLQFAGIIHVADAARRRRHAEDVQYSYSPSSDQSYVVATDLRRYNGQDKGGGNESTFGAAAR
jgi:hypothetical protein